MPDYDPNYIPSGPNNRENPYYMKVNNSRISRSQETRERFMGEPPAQIVVLPAGSVLSTFSFNNEQYTQILMDNLSGQFDVQGQIEGCYLALVPPGGAGGRTAGVGTRAGGGAGGLPRLLRSVSLPAGVYTVTQGTPGTGATLANGWGGSGTDSTLSGPINLTAQGGGGGGGNVTNQNAGRDGGNGGGGMGASTLAYPGGVSTSDGYPGGAGYANADNTLKSGGGGGGAGGAGQAGTIGVGGTGGLGVLVDFMNPPRTVCGGGGGHGQTAGVGQGGGTNSDSTDQPGWGAGSGARVANPPANGGLPFFALIAKSSRIRPATISSGRYLDEPEAGSSAAINSRSPNAIDLSYVNASRRYISWDWALPLGTRIEFDVTNTVNLYVRVSDLVELGPSLISDLNPIVAAGTSHVDCYVSTAANVKRYFGFLAATNGSVIITNFKLTLP